jgi:hypothetical protein
MRADSAEWSESTIAIDALATSVLMPVATL